MTSDLSSALEILDDDELNKSTYTLLYFTLQTTVVHQQDWRWDSKACQSKNDWYDL